MKFVTHALPVALLALLCSCSPVNVPRDYVPSPDAGSGLVVFSFTTGGPDAGLYYRRVGETKSIGVDLRRLGISLDWAQPRGRLVVLELPAGSYEIHSWIIADGRRIARPVEPFSVPFAVVPGRAAYLGNIHFEFGRRQYAVQTIDTRERDLPLLFTRYPGLREEYVDVTLARVK